MPMLIQGLPLCCELIMRCHPCTNAGQSRSSSAVDVTACQKLKLKVCRKLM